VRFGALGKLSRLIGDLAASAPPVPAALTPEQEACDQWLYDTVDWIDRTVADLERVWRQQKGPPLLGGLLGNFYELGC
jgi:hypothetical protein